MTDKITGLDCGADDYITRPFDFEELLARIRTALRRTADKAQALPKIEVADLVIDPAARQAWRAEHLLKLTTREYELLELLARNAGQVLTKASIFDRIWGSNDDVG